MFTEQEIDKLYIECGKLSSTSVIEEESHIFDKPLMIAMSTVLSLNRRWYSVAVPARIRFENSQYSYLSERPLNEYVNMAREIVGKDEDWNLLSISLWENNESQKARQLTQLAEYFSSWFETYHPNIDEIIALRNWANSVQKDEFLPLIKGLGPRAYEQLLWYIERVNSVKYDRHIANFLKNTLGRDVADLEGISALKTVAKKMEISATQLDACIWDYMQSQANS